MKGRKQMGNQCDWIAQRATVFGQHIAKLHNADFEVCHDPACRAVVVEEVRRGLLSAEDVWPPIKEALSYES